MDPQAAVALIGEGLQVVGLVEGLIAKIRSQSGLTDDQILEAALAQDADTHAKVKAYLEKLGAS